MKLSKRGEYGLKALIDLASQEDPQTLVQIKDIAAAPADSGEIPGTDHAGDEERRHSAQPGRVSAAAIIWRGRRMRSRWGRWCACSMGRWRPFRASARWPTSAACAKTKRRAACGWRCWTCATPSPIFWTRRRWPMSRPGWNAPSGPEKRPARAGQTNHRQNRPALERALPRGGVFCGL